MSSGWTAHPVELEGFSQAKPLWQEDVQRGFAGQGELKGRLLSALTPRLHIWCPQRVMLISEGSKRSFGSLRR